MTTVAPPGSGQAPPPQGDPTTSSSQLSWEGDKMFNIYIYDYCYKRGFRKTAHELLAEAEIPPESTPPINARQGLLFEWWSVFWVLFTAKANGNGTDEAMLYTQHQAQQTAQRQAAQRLQQQTQPPLGQSQPPMQHQQPPMSRLINGMPTRQPGFMPHGPLLNGVGPSTLQQGPMQPGGPTSFPMGGPGPQPNGIPGPSGPPPVPGAPSAQSQNFSQLLPGQRPPLTGQQQRGPNGPPFQSPTMAHSPQNTGAAQGQQQQQHPQAPMSQLGPSPHLTQMNRGGMPPPNGPQGMSNSGQQAHTPTQSFQQLGRPPSRTATPGQGGMIPHPSPSMVSRQPPGGMIPGSDPRQAQEGNIVAEIMRIPPHLLTSLKQEAGLTEKDPNSFTLEDKQRIVNIYRQRARSAKPGSQGVNNATAGPSNPMMQPPQRNPGQQQQRGNKRNSTSPGQDHDNLPRNDSSPPERKRVRRSPMGMEQQPPTPTTYPHPPQQPQQSGPGGQQQQQQQLMGNGLMRGPMGGPLNGFPHQPGMPQMGNPMNMAMGQVMGATQMGNAMSPAMSHPGGGMIAPHMQQIQAREAQYRQTFHNMPKSNMSQGGLNNSIPNSGNAGSPSSSDPSYNSNGPQGQGQGGGPQFNPGIGPNSRMGQNKAMSMMPPPSPVVNGPPKDQNGSNKDNKNTKNSSSSHPEGSPRNPPNSGQTPNPGGTAPPTPAPGGANQNQNQQNQNQNQNAGQNMAPSPSSILGGNPPTMNPASSLGQQPSQPAPSAPDMLFPTDFIHSVASSLDEFDTSIFRPDGDINFERDFGQWFNPDDVGVLDMK